MMMMVVVEINVDGSFISICSKHLIYMICFIESSEQTYEKYAMITPVIQVTKYGDKYNLNNLVSITLNLVSWKPSIPCCA